MITLVDVVKEYATGVITNEELDVELQKVNVYKPNDTGGDDTEDIVWSINDGNSWSEAVRLLREDNSVTEEHLHTIHDKLKELGKL